MEPKNLLRKTSSLTLPLLLLGCTSSNFETVTGSITPVSVQPATINAAPPKPAPSNPAPYKPEQPKANPVRVANAPTAKPRQLRFGDSDPVAFAGGSPGAYRIHGVDVSKYQGEINWRKARKGGMSFAFIKATEGGDHSDESFLKNWKAAKRAGMPRGAYHFYYFCASAKSQARWFIKNVPRDRKSLPPVLDMEWNRASKTCKKRPSPAVVVREMQIFLNRVERYYRKRPIIYTTPDFYDDNLKGRFKKYPIWLRTVKEHPRRRYPGRKWVFWQYTGTGLAPGFPTGVDINVFNGSATAWKKWLKKVQR